MKKTLASALFICLCSFSCFLFNPSYDDNGIKVKNELSETLTVVKIGDEEYRNIAAGSTSEAKNFNGGSYNLTASTESDIQYNQSVDFAGRYLDFLVIFKADGSINVQKE